MFKRLILGLVLVAWVSASACAQAEAAATMPLVVQSFLADDDFARSFAQAYPDIQVEYRTEFLPAAEIARQIRTGEADADLYCMKYDHHLQLLIRKGFTANLAAAPALVAAVDRMYPQIQDAVLWEGGLYAYPIAPAVFYWSARLDLLDAFGLSLPETYLDYLAMYAEWSERGAADQTDVQFCYDYGVRVDLLLDMLALYERTYGSPDAPLSFDHPALRQALGIITALPPSLYERDLDNSREIADANGKVIFETWNTAPLEAQPGATGADGEAYQLFLPPPFAEGERQFLPADLYVYVVNPLSQNQVQARLFLEHMIEHAQPTLRYLAFADLSEPVVSEAVLIYEERAKAALDYWAALLKTAPKDERGEIQDAIAQANMNLQYAQAHRWLISPEALAYYRATAPLLDFYVPAQLPAAAEEIRGILIQLLSGQITTDRAIVEMDKRMLAVYLEQM